MVTMKFNPFVTSNCIKNPKHHFNVSSHGRRKLTSSQLSQGLWCKYNVHSMPIHKEDEVQVVWRLYNGQQIGRVVQVYRKKSVIYIKQVQHDKANHTTFHSPHQGGYHWAKTGQRWKKILERKAKSQQVKKEKENIG